MIRSSIAAALAVLLSGCATAAPLAPPAVAAAPAGSVSPADRASITAALDAVYAVISGPVGTPRDFARMRTLFTPDARLIAITPRGLSGGTVEDYITKAGSSLVAQGFTERALVNRIEVYGDLAHAWSSYEGTYTAPDGKPGRVRGINSFQLVRQSDGRWLVQSIFWQAETPATPLPADMDTSR